MGHASLAEVVEEISNLADAVLDCTYRRIRLHLEQRYGKPGVRTKTATLVSADFQWSPSAS
jgi:hypothetical protein